MSYNIKYTDANKASFQVPDDSVIADKVDVSFLGRTKLEYGEILNANLLHILENFACPESVSSPGTPDLSAVTYRPGSADTTKLLQFPTQGQLWFNKTTLTLNSWDGIRWVPLSMGGDIAFNWGVLCHGQTIPRPISPTTGYLFPYSECVWIVSPESVDQEFEYMLCSTDASGVVTMQYGLQDTSVINGNASYMIVGIKGNVNIGDTITPEPPEPTPTPTPTSIVASPTPTETAAPTPTPTATQGSSPTPTPTNTPPVTPTRTPTPTPTVTPTITPSNVPLTVGPGSNMDAMETYLFTLPCDFPPASSGDVTAVGNINVSGGSGSFTYAWSHVPDGASNFPITFSSSGNDFYATAASKVCPYQGTAFGTVSVLVTDTITGQTATFNGSYTVEFTG